MNSSGKSSATPRAGSTLEGSLPVTGGGAVASGERSLPAREEPEESPRKERPRTATKKKELNRPRPGTGEARKLPVLAPSQEAATILKELQDPTLAAAAFRKIWEIPRNLIPDLIREVENPVPSQVERLTILVLDPDFVVEGKAFLANRIHGLGQMEVVEEVADGDQRIMAQAYTKMSIGFTPNKKHKKVVMDKFGGFPLGVVVRAGLINRFKSTRYPSSSDDEQGPGKLVDWWREFYLRASPDLEN